jgi:hypothetical protein
MVSTNQNYNSTMRISPGSAYSIQVTKCLAFVQLAHTKEKVLQVLSSTLAGSDHFILFFGLCVCMKGNLWHESPPPQNNKSSDSVANFAFASE